MPETQPPPERRHNYELRVLITDFAQMDGLPERFATRAAATFCRTRRLRQKIEQKVRLALGAQSEAPKSTPQEERPSRPSPPNKDSDITGPR